MGVDFGPDGKGSFPSGAAGVGVAVAAGGSAGGSAGEGLGSRQGGETDGGEEVRRGGSLGVARSQAGAWERGEAGGWGRVTWERVVAAVVVVALRAIVARAAGGATRRGVAGCTTFQAGDHHLLIVA